MGIPPSTTAAAARLAPTVARRVRGLGAGLIAALAASGAVLAVDPGGAGVETLVERLLVCLTLTLAAALIVARPVLVASNRVPWALAAAGVCCYAAGFVVWYAGLGRPLASVLWAAFYPLAYAGGALIIRSWARDVRSPAIIDGVIVGCGAAALAAALLVPFREIAGDGLDIVLAFAYAMFDILLLATVLVGGALARALPDRSWTLAGTSFALLLAADVQYLQRVSDGADGPAHLALPAILWMAAMALFACAAWQPERAVRLDAQDWLAWSTLVLPAGFVTAAVGLLLAHDIEERPVVASLSAAAIAAAVVRTVLMYGELRRATATNRIAMTDDVTGLRTRRGLTLRLSDELAGHERDGAGVALVVVDVEGFGAVAGALGPAAGDEVLRRVAERLDGSPATVAGRLHADEFAIVLRGGTREDGVRLAHDLLARVGRPLTVADVTLQLAAHAGVTAVPGDVADAEALVRHAEAAMEHGRRNGARVVAYDPAFDRVARQQLTMLGELRQGLASGQIVAHFQPQVDPSTGQVTGVEALVRWEHPERGLVPPGAFLDVAAAAGLMRTLTERVLGLALERVAAWRAAGLDVGVSVNVAAPNLLDRDFPAHVQAALRAAGVPPTLLTLEITEDVVMAETDQAIEDLGRLRALGVRLSLDDFGTGHSSLAKLKGLPIQELKIDRSFVCRLREDRHDRAIVEAAIQLARDLGLTVVAEGIEDDGAWTLLAALGCDAIQGYRLSRPLPPGAIDAWLEDVPLTLPDAVRPRAAGAGGAGPRGAP